MKLKNMILIISVILCIMVSFATPVFADSEFTTQTNTVYIQDTAKNNTTNNTVIIESQQTELPNTGITENYLFVGLAISLAVVAVYSYKKMTDYKNL